MLSVGARHDHRSRPSDWDQMSASHRFQLPHSATSTGARSVTCVMNMVLCSTCTSTPVSSMCSSRSPTFPSSMDSSASANLRPTCRSRWRNASSENAGKRKPFTLPSTTQNCCLTPDSSGDASGTGRYCFSDPSR